MFAKGRKTIWEGVLYSEKKKKGLFFFFFNFPINTITATTPLIFSITFSYYETAGTVILKALETTSHPDVKQTSDKQHVLHFIEIFQTRNRNSLAARQRVPRRSTAQAHS